MSKGFKRLLFLFHTISTFLPYGSYPQKIRRVYSLNALTAVYHLFFSQLTR